MSSSSSCNSLLLLRFPELDTNEVGRTQCTARHDVASLLCSRASATAAFVNDGAVSLSPQASTPSAIVVAGLFAATHLFFERQYLGDVRYVCTYVFSLTLSIILRQLLTTTSILLVTLFSVYAMKTCFFLTHVSTIRIIYYCLLCAEEGERK